ncbi:MAG: TonB-dependent receptor [Bacteroidales bacterium]|nr:TonB-dependent receptor [Bacteroidales bacterium]
MIQTKYGLDQTLVNGVFYENIYRNDLGFPSFPNDEFNKGYIVFHNRRYDNLLLKYNVFNQNLVVQESKYEKNGIVYIPPVDFISEFSLEGMVFRKYQFQDSVPGFYQEVFTGNIKCLYTWEKSRKESDHKGSFMAHEYFEAKRKTFLVINDTLHQYRSKASFINLFPIQYKKNISFFIKEKGIKFRKSPDEKIAELAAYCENLLFQTNSKAMVDSIKNEPDIIIGKSFEKFTTSLESNTSYHFFYEPEWVKDILVDTSFSGSDLQNLLSEILKSSRLNFYIDQDNNVIIYPGKAITEEIPEFIEYNTLSSTKDTNSITYLTSTERKYRESQKVAELELVVVGDKNLINKSKTNIVSGRITDQSTGEPLLGATVFVKELGKGTATDLDGYFNMVLPAGRHLLVANYVSQKEKRFYLEVYSDGSISIPLEKELIDINEVQITADRHDNVKGLQMGYEQISIKTMKEIPSVLGEKDILKVALMLPGVQSAGEGSSGLNVRGGTADQNLFYINKMPVYNSSHLFGFFTAINPDIVSDFALYKSAVPSKFGGRVSSVFDVSTRQGNKKEFFGQGGISPISAHTAIEGPIIKDKSSIVLSARASYSDWILSRLNDINLQQSKAAFHDIAGTINTEINDKNILRLFAYNSYDQFSLATTDDYNYSTTGGVVNLKHFFSSSLNGDFAAVFSQYGFNHTSKSNPSEAYRQNYLIKHTEFKADFVKLTGINHRILFGASGILYNLDRGKILPYGDESTRIPIDLNVEKGVESAVYLSDEFTILSRLKMDIGLRYSYYTFLGPDEVYEYFPDSPIDKDNIKEIHSFNNSEIVKSYHGPEPRVALNYILGSNSSVKASYNRIRQYIFMLSNTIAISPTDQWKLTDYHMTPPVTDQLSVGYYHNFPEKGITSSIELYNKWTKNIVEYKDGVDFLSGDPTEWLLVQGKQDSYGAEFMLKKNTGNLSGWINYTYSRSFIQVASSIPTEQVNSGKKYPSNFDRPHSLNVVTSLRRNRRLSFSANLVYSTGRPITYPIAVFPSEGHQHIHYSERNAYRIPDYFRIDFSMNLEGNLLSKKWLHSYWMFSIYNLTGRRNAYSVYYEANNKGVFNAYKLSIFGEPIVTVSWHFKFGNYTSE